MVIHALGVLASFQAKQYSIQQKISYLSFKI